MKKKEVAKKQQPSPPQPVSRQVKDKSLPLWLWALVPVVITAICFSPILQNSFTNWDDNLYVTGNEMLRGPDWKSIFSVSHPVVSNYHPFTIASLAFNYQLSGEEPYTYFLVNLLLHVLNTGLVFGLIWLLSGGKPWVAAFAALVFGIQPMHVESVAWLAERKDVLYTFFFLLSLMAYWHYIDGRKYAWLGLSFLLGVFSMLSKPSAVVLPLVLLLLDYWKGRKFDVKLLLEKVPFFIIALVMGVITLKIQSIEAMADLDMIPLGLRFLYAGYGLIAYFIRFIFPYPLSAFHPYISSEQLFLPVLFSVLSVVSLGALIYYRSNRLLVFSILFFVVNLLLVLQVVAVGSAMIAERYTYVPYIGLAFLSGMLLDQYLSRHNQTLRWLVLGIVALVFGTMTYNYTKVWNNSISLWGNVINYYPDAPIPRTNRANANFLKGTDPAYVQQADSILRLCIEDCSVAIKNRPTHIRAYSNRGSAYLQFLQYKEALADGQMIVKLKPDDRIGHSICGKAYAGLKQKDAALESFNKCIAIKPEDDGYYSRGSLLFNQFERYEDAMADFDKAIAINPKGLYYMTRSFCNYRLGNIESAKSDAQMALQLGQPLPKKYREMVGV